MPSNSAWPSRLASTSTLTTVSLRFLVEPPAQLFLQARGSFFHGGGRVNVEAQPPRFLICHALLDALINTAVFLRQLDVMLVHILDHDVEVLARQAGHGSVDVVEIVATVQIIKNIHHRQAMPFNLRPPAKIDDSNR